MVVKLLIPLLVFMVSFLSCNNESPTSSKPIDTSSGMELTDSGDQETQDQETQSTGSGDQGIHSKCDKKTHSKWGKGPHSKWYKGSHSKWGKGSHSKWYKGSKPINPCKIQGTWRFSRATETWDSKTEPVRMTGREFFFVIDANQVVCWLYYPLFPNSSKCIYRTVSDYILRGNRMIGENFEGERELEDQVLSWNTVIEMDGDKLLIITNYKHGETKTWYETMEFEPYNGVVPPEEWPDEECPEDVLERGE